MERGSPRSRSPRRGARSPDSPDSPPRVSPRPWVPSSGIPEPYYSPVPLPGLSLPRGIIDCIHFLQYLLNHRHPADVVIDFGNELPPGLAALITFLQILTGFLDPREPYEEEEDPWL